MCSYGEKLTAMWKSSIRLPFSLPGKRGKGAKTLRVAIFSGSHFGTADQLFKKHRYAIIGKRNAYRSSQSNVLPYKTSQCDRFCDRKKAIAMRIRR